MVWANLRREAEQSDSGMDMVWANLRQEAELEDEKSSGE